MGRHRGRLLLSPTSQRCAPRACVRARGGPAGMVACVALRETETSSPRGAASPRSSGGTDGEESVPVHGPRLRQDQEHQGHNAEMCDCMDCMHGINVA